MFGMEIVAVHFSTHCSVVLHTFSSVCRPHDQCADRTADLNNAAAEETLPSDIYILYILALHA